ncbi:MAG: hypothetical protein GQ523_01405 [Methanophagales archaeon]|nr:hypothetical protein [Methanophagales archaeon]
MQRTMNTPLKKASMHTYRQGILGIVSWSKRKRGSVSELYMFLTGITTHLTAITAYHVGRTDLMSSPIAFRRLSLG